MICMICNTPTKLQHSSEGCNTPVWAETTSSSGFSSHCVLTTLLTSFQGMCVPEAEGEPDPKASPSPHPLLGGRGCFGERGPRSHCCGQHRLFRPHVAREVSQRGRRGKSDLSCHGCMETSVPSPVPALAAGQPPTPSAAWLCLRLRAEGRSRMVSCPLHSSRRRRQRFGVDEMFQAGFPNHGY